MSFTHLHVHTEYSLLDGMPKINALFKRAKELSMKSVAITDHGVMYGVVDFYKAGLKEGIKPILGCELYITMDSMYNKSPSNSSYAHLVLLAKNNEGYKNLMKLVSLGFTDGFYYKPRIDYEVLEKHSAGLIALSACLAGDIPQLIMDDRQDEAEELAVKLSALFGKDDFYLELQDHGIPEQKRVNKALIEISRNTGIPLVATNDVHYLTKQDAEAQGIMLCVQTLKTVNDPDRMKFDTDEFYFKSEEEMRKLFAEVPEAIDNTEKIAEKCNVEIEFGQRHLPKFELPKDYTEAFDYLRDKCYIGAKERYGEITPVIKERLDYELNTINKMGYVDYFLIVDDLKRYSESVGIYVGPGRGSGASSVVAYCLGITAIDPIKYSLLFERFLNPERVSMPDIDLDFSHDRRGEVIDYITRKYGQDQVAMIVAFGRMKAKAVIRNVGRALDLPYAFVDSIAKMIPANVLNITIDDAMEQNVKLREIYDENTDAKKLIDMSRKLEGLVKNTSEHASGVVITTEPLTNFVPIQLQGEDTVTQFDMTLLEELGLLKIDVLGLRFISVIGETIKLVKETRGDVIRLDKIPLDDKNVFEMLSKGDGVGVFQIESAGMRQLFRELRPRDIEDIIAGIAMYRPGPMDQIPRYLENRRDPSQIKYTDECLEGILSVTFGCMLYQEQVMQIVRDVAGYSYGRSDLVRRAMAKKKHDVMLKERENFIHGIVDEDGNIVIPGAVRNGVSEESANRIFDEMIEFANYAFNKAHAASYAVVCYWTAYLKYHYPIEYMAALISSVAESPDKVAEYILYCNKMGIKTANPDINESTAKFSVTNDRIIFGLSALKNVGVQAIDEIVEERKKNGKFINFSDFCRRSGVLSSNKRVVESLIKCGAFDSFGVHRSQMLSVFEHVLDAAHREKNNVNSNQISLFEMFEEEERTQIQDIDYPDIPELPFESLLKLEKEITGMYISGHPLDGFAAVTSNLDSTQAYAEINKRIEEGTSSSDDDSFSVSDNASSLDGKFIRLGGMITASKQVLTKKKQLMRFIQFEDRSGELELIAFPKIVEEFGELLIVDSYIYVEGRTTYKEDEGIKVIIEKVLPLESIGTDMPQEMPTEKKPEVLYINAVSKELLDKNIEKINEVLLSSHGETPVKFVIYESGTKKVLLSDKRFWVNPTAALVEDLGKILGEKNVKLV